ncbi:MAG: hypothetical protein WBC63_07075, partial [Candidatus Bipolaricaulia bacterium]
CEGIDVFVTLTAIDTCGASASDSFTLRVNNVNHAPAVDAGNDLCVDEGASIVLQPVAGDPDGDPLAYRWTVATGSGTFEDPTALRAIFHAALIDDCEGTTVTLTLSAIDPCGAAVCDSLVIRVRNVNRTPTVDLGPDFSLAEGSAVRLTPVVADPECEHLEYRWSVTGGRLDRSDAQGPTFVAPMTECCAGEAVTVQLTVIDPCGLSATDSVTIYVNNVNAPPIVELGPALTINEGESIRLTPEIIDPDGDLLAYSWTTSGGILTESHDCAPVFTAPIVDNCEGVDLVLTLTAVDPCGLTVTDTLNVHVANVNKPPLVYADP